jgi:hypothetical protein
MAYSSFTAVSLYRSAFLSLLFVFGFVNASFSQKTYAAGEVLTYKAYYHLGLVWVPAAKVTLSVVPNEDSRYLTLRASGVSYKRYDLFFKVRENYESTILKSTLLPATAGRDAVEGSYKATESYVFNQAAGTVDYKIIRNSGKNSIGTIANTAGYFDILSAAYYVREFDFNKLHMQERFTVNTVVDGDTYGISVQYLGNEICKDNNDRSVLCAKFSISTIKGTVFKGDEHIFIWMSYDSAKIPVKVTTKILIGEVNVQLVSAHGTK